MSAARTPRDVRLVHEALRRIQDEDMWADPWLRALRRREPDRRLTALVERRLLGVLERHALLVAWISRHLREPIRRLPATARDALLLGAWRLRWEDSAPPWAIVDSAVQAAREGGGARQSGVINAVLRRLADEVPSLPEALGLQDPALASALPAFWAEHLAPLLPKGELVEALAALRRNPGLHAVATDPADAAAVEAGLQQDGANPRSFPYVSGAWHIGDGHAMFGGAMWAAGRVAVQDAGIAAWLSDVAEDAWGPLWDAFAAPGGKLLGLAARRPDLWCVGSDHHPGRAALIAAEARRRGMAASLVVADAHKAPWRPDVRFGTVLADLPCTATGTVGRHPELALRLREADIADRATQQVELVLALAGQVAPGGRLWLTTCSLFAAENEAVAEAVLQARPNWRRHLLRHPLEPDAEPAIVQRFWPHRHGTAGFTVQCLVAPSSGD